MSSNFRWAAALAVVFSSGALVAQEVSTGADPSARRSTERVLTQEVRQQSVGRRTDRVARVVREEIVQELQQNKLGSREELERLARMVDVLIVVAGTHVPEAVEDLRAARAALNALLAREHLGQATDTQRTILDLLTGLAEKLAAREQLSSLVEQAEELVTHQRELNTDTRQTALKTIGKPLQALAPEQRQELTGLAQRQQEQGRRLRQLTSDIDYTAQELTPTEPRRARALEQARDFARTQRLEATMGEIVRELQQNQVLSAAQKEQRTLEHLEELRDRLAAGEQNPFDELTRRQRDLEDLIGEQQDLRRETGEMTPQSPTQALEALEQRQGALAQRSRQLAAQLAPAAPQSSQNLAQAGEEMQEATDQLDQRQPEQAAQEQDQALAALEAARQALSAQLSQLAQMQFAQLPFDQRLLDILSQQRDQLGLLQRISEDIIALNQLVQRQEAEGRKTDEELQKPEADRRPEPLAREERNLAEKADEVAESIARYDQESSQHVGQAQDLLVRAADELEQGDLAGARPPQVEGLAQLKKGRDVLQDKFKRILELLAQLEQQRQEFGEGEPEPPGMPEMASLDDLIELANNLVELQRLAGDQEGTRDETAQTQPEEAPQLAPGQGQLEERAQDLARKAQRLSPEPAADIRLAGQEMDQAEARLEVRQPRPALGHQEAALRGLRQAEQQMSLALQEMLLQQLQMLAQMMAPSQTFDPRDEMRLRLAGLEALAEQMAAGSWRVALPPRAREEISQSLQERFPKGYERLLRAYFQNLAQSEER